MGAMIPWQFETKDGKALMIRPVRSEDAPHLHEAARHPDVARMIQLHPALELAETQEFIDKEEVGRHYLVAECEGRAVGSTTLHQLQRPRLQHMARLGLLVGRPYWNRGIGSFLVQAALEIADNWLNLRRVELDVFTDNEAAIHLYERFGFHREGRRRRVAYGPDGWRDNLLMARLRHVDEKSVQSEESNSAARQHKPVPAAPLDPNDLVIRAPHPDDAEDLHDLYRHPLVARTTLQLPSQTIGVSERRLAQHGPGLFRYFAEAHGRVVGSITLYKSQNPAAHHVANLGMGVHPDHWRQGVGSRLMEAALDLADNWLNLSRVELEVTVDNPGGIRLYEKFGFQIEGTRRFHMYGDGRWADSHFMARLRN
jgi:putative acetyltransferase